MVNFIPSCLQNPSINKKVYIINRAEYVSFVSYTSWSFISIPAILIKYLAFRVVEGPRQSL